MLDLYLLTAMHLLVDGVCGAVLAIYALQEPYYAPIVFCFSLYTAFAFGMQGPIGWLLDRFSAYIKYGLLASTVFLGLGTIPQLSIGVQATLLGLGNCFFHVVGGSYVLRKYSSYSELGLFVSSGAIGLGLGLFRIVNVWVLLALACILTVLVYKNMQEVSQIRTFCPNAVARDNSSLELMGIAALLFACIVLRGFGSGNNLQSSYIMLLPWTFALGKLLGGFICDKIGYKKTVLLIMLVGFIGLKMQGFYETSLAFLFF